jgi:hypothetical protein
MVPKKDADGNDTGEMIAATPTADKERLTRDWKADLKDWKQGEAIVKQQIAATIPRSGTRERPLRSGWHSRTISRTNPEWSQWT